MDENLEWLTQNTEDQKSNCKVIKKWQRPPFLHQPPPLLQVYPPFLAKKSVPPLVTQFLEGPSPPLIRGGGGFQLFN